MRSNKGHEEYLLLHGHEKSCIVPST